MTPRQYLTDFYRLTLAGLILAALWSCSSKKEQFIREKVAERVNDYRRNETAKCRKALLAEAERMVDSLLLHQAMQEVNDSLRQRRAPKPLPPGKLSPIDSLPVKPIFE